jgi:hypothetical protein
MKTGGALEGEASGRGQSADPSSFKFFPFQGEISLKHVSTEFEHDTHCL